MPEMVAIKSLSYATRRLLPGDEFTASTRDARILAAIGKAKAVRVPGRIAPPPPSVVQKIQQPPRHPLDHDGDGAKGGSKAPEGDGEALQQLRAEYAELTGKRFFAGWDAAELQRRIDTVLAS